jgi:hypothetical protein
MTGSAPPNGCNMDLALGYLIELLVRITPLSIFLRWDIEDFGLLAPEWSAS